MTNKELNDYFHRFEMIGVINDTIFHTCFGFVDGKWVYKQPNPIYRWDNRISLKTRWSDGIHDGDCIKQPQTCWACEWDELSQTGFELTKCIDQGGYFPRGEFPMSLTEVLEEDPKTTAIVWDTLIREMRRFDVWIPTHLTIGDEEHR